MIHARTEPTTLTAETDVTVEISHSASYAWGGTVADLAAILGVTVARAIDIVDGVGEDWEPNEFLIARLAGNGDHVSEDWDIESVYEG